ncbi:hypothetical protein [Oscillatoria acuminata]|uniref:hypothetical protein n=1 Tax=Oscillatoria acuminata TaxID=118323 RepID=UPI0002F1CC6E|nr:hypothetical protein [Oscillatoria acuminata]
MPGPLGFYGISLPAYDPTQPNRSPIISLNLGPSTQGRSPFQHFQPSGIAMGCNP